MSFILPLLNIVIEKADANKQVYMSSCNVVLSQNKATCFKLQSECEPSHVAAIGFDYSDPGDEFYDDDEYEDKNKINKIGF